mgnify:FL=1
MSLMYAVSNRTDGQLAEDDLEAIPHFDRKHIESFIAADLWRQEGSAWVIADYMATQTSRAQLEAAELARVKEAQRSALNRARARASAVGREPEVRRTADSTAYGTAYDTGQARQGQDRQKTLSPESQSTAEPSSPKALEALVGKGRTSLADDPDAWPKDEIGLRWRNEVEEKNLTTLEALMKAEGLNEAQARKWMAAAYPGRRF